MKRGEGYNVELAKY